MRPITRIVAVVAAAAALSVGGAVAWAAWATHGAGTARSKAVGSIPVSVLDVVTSPTTLLYPGGDGDLMITVRDDNDFNIRIIALVKNPAPITADAGHTTGCPVAATGVTMPNPLVSVSWLVHAHETATFEANGVVHMDNSSANGCQGATFHIPLALAAASTS